MVDITFPAATDDAILLLVRIIVGFSFLVAARNKAKNIGKFAKNNGIPKPLAAVVMGVEFLAGLMLVTGIAAQIAALALAVLMLGTIRLHVFVGNLLIGQLRGAGNMTSC